MKHVLYLTLLATLLTSCGGIKTTVNNAIDNGANIVDELINDLAAESDDWENLIREAMEKLPQEAKTIIGNDLTNMANGLIASTGTEFRCNVDFLRNRLRQDLQQLKSKLLGRGAIIREPHICQAVPRSIRMSLNPNDRVEVNLYGYDFLAKDLQVKLYNSDGVTDQTSNISTTSNYHANLNMGGNGIRLTDKSKKIAILWKGTIISEVAIIQNAIVPCKSKDVTPNAYGPVTLVPTRTRGDSEFDGNGPKVHTSVSLKITSGNTKIAANLFTRFKETKSDWSTGEKKKTIPDFYIAPAGWKIEKILSDPTGSFSYTDNNHSQDTKDVNDGPLRKIVAIGDRKGKDIGNGSQVAFHFNRIKVRLRESNDCDISTRTMEEMIAMGSLDEGLQLQFETALSEVNEND